MPRSRFRPPFPRRVSKGITLVELMISMVAASALIVGLSSSLYITLQAAGNGQQQQMTTMLATQIMARIATDLNVATQVTWEGGSTVTVKVPDRDNDGDEETVTYSRSILTGWSLVRTVNFRSEILAQSVDDFSVTYYQPEGSCRIVEFSLKLRDDDPSVVTSSVALLNAG